MEFVVRKIEIVELDELQKVVSSVVNSDFNYYSQGIKRKILKEDLNMKIRIDDSIFSLLGAFYKNKLIGLLTGLNPIGGVANIHWMMVLKEYQNRGVGRKLMEKYISMLQVQGVHGIHLFCPKENVPFYEKLGFEKVGLVRKSFYGYDDYFMNKIIPELE